MAVLIEQALPVNMGIDVGQITDPTALCITEVEQRPTGQLRITGEQKAAYVDHRGGWHPEQGIERVMRAHYTIRHITRLPLGTSYPDVAVHIAELLCNPLLLHRRVRVILDVTGVGRPVYDLLKTEIGLRRSMVLRSEEGTTIAERKIPKGEQHYVTLVPCSFTRGETYNKRTGALGKAYLVSRGQALLQSGYIHAPDTKEVKAMLEELKHYEIKVSDDGKETFGGVGAHDDLATSLLLSVLENPFPDQASFTNRVY